MLAGHIQYIGPVQGIYMGLGETLGHGNPKEAMAGGNIQDFRGRVGPQRRLQNLAMAWAAGNIIGVMPRAKSTQIGSSGASEPCSVADPPWRTACVSVSKLPIWIGCIRNLNARPMISRRAAVEKERGIRGERVAIPVLVEKTHDHQAIAKDAHAPFRSAASLADLCRGPAALGDRRKQVQVYRGF